MKADNDRAIVITSFEERDVLFVSYAITSYFNFDNCLVCVMHNEQVLPMVRDYIFVTPELLPGI
jgi:hypothetical protein